MMPNELAKFMHDEYEKFAKKAGWRTQKSCQVGWDDLPKANRKVMNHVARRVLKKLKTCEVPK
jgi:hypothetical protein